MSYATSRLVSSQAIIIASYVPVGGFHEKSSTACWRKPGRVSSMNTTCKLLGCALQVRNIMHRSRASGRGSSLHSIVTAYRMLATTASTPIN